MAKPVQTKGGGGDNDNKKDDIRIVDDYNGKYIIRIKKSKRSIPRHVTASYVCKRQRRKDNECPMRECRRAIKYTCPRLANDFHGHPTASLHVPAHHNAPKRA